jgi:hypothetical protein
MHRRSKRILTVIGIIVIAFGALYAIALVRATVQLRRAYAALEADGRPMRAADVVPPEVPDTQNAAVLYQSAALMLKGQPAGDKNLLERLSKLSNALFDKPNDPDKIAQQRQDVLELRQRMSEPVVVSALAIVAEGTQRPACQFEQERSFGFSADSPFAGDVRALSRILTARVYLDAEAGEMDKAWSTVQTQMQFTNALRDDPATISQLTLMSTVRHACRLVRGLCETGLPREETRQWIEAFLKNTANIEPFIRAIDGERLLIGEWFFNLPREEMDRALRKEFPNKNDALPEAFQKAMHRLGFRFLVFRPRLVTDHAAYLQTMRKRVQLLQGPYRSQKEVREYLGMSRWNLLTDLLASRIDKGWYCHMAVDVQLTRAGLALLQYKQAHGQFPATLDALGIEGLTDPYSEKPLLYHPEGEGFVIYSVGEDMKDNGGTPRPEKQDSNPRHRKQPEYDEIWRFPDPSSRIPAGNR